MFARAHACPACGAPVEELARRCQRCSSPVATVRCATCFHMNLPEATECGGCGSALGLEPVGEAAALLCPACKEGLQAFRRGSAAALFDCARCGGQFVEHALHHELLEPHEHAALPEAALRSLARPDPRTSYIPCPACASLMNRKNFSGISGVIVDVCKKHGTFFDAGELPRVLAFVAGGGLEKAHRREAEEEAEAHRREAAAAAVIHIPTRSADRSFGAFRAPSRLTRLLLDILLS